MPALPLYLEPADARILLASLNADDEIAFLVPEKRPLARICDLGVTLPELPVQITSREMARGASDAIASFRDMLDAAKLDVPHFQSSVLLDLASFRQAIEQERSEPKSYPCGPRRWRATRKLESLPDGHYALWHVPGGPLTIPTETGEDVEVANPWSGWAERRVGPERGRPFMTGVSAIRLEVWTNSTGVGRLEMDADLGRWINRWEEDETALRRSCFEWTGNDDGALERRASEATERWWKSLERWTREHARAVPLVPGATEPGLQVWALSSAQASISRGKLHGH